MKNVEKKVKFVILVLMRKTPKLIHQTAKELMKLQQKYSVAKVTARSLAI
jgi:hypothetical protein